ncbi:hypothetical protein [Shewanella maritima]|uniref:hypothetical protein n=1 Tax=Shewanella maritima TaxID=2520507 RepID=UPI003735349E
MSALHLSRTLTATSLISVLLITTGCVVNIPASHADSLDHHQQQLTLNRAQMDTLVAETGAGKLKVQGAQVEQITLVADIYKTENVDVDLSLKSHGDEARLVAKIDRPLLSMSSDSSYIDVTLKVPADMALEIEDGSGSIDIEKMVGQIDIKDGSGSIDIHGGKDITINDGSGSITVEHAMGNVNVADGSGGIEIEHVKGNVSVNDGSGSIVIEHIAGMVSINDGSGSIEVAHTQGLTIGSDGSGSVDFEHINGPVSMNKD